MTQQLHIVGNIHIAFGGQTTKNHPVDTQLTTETDVLLHPFYLQWGIEEIAATGTDDDMQTSRLKETACHHYLAIRGGHTTFGDASTKFYSVGTSLLRSQTTLHAIGADFKLIIFSFFHSFKFSIRSTYKELRSSGVEEFRHYHILPRSEAITSDGQR